MKILGAFLLGMALMLGVSLLADEWAKQESVELCTAWKARGE